MKPSVATSSLAMRSTRLISSLAMRSTKPNSTLPTLRGSRLSPCGLLVRPVYGVFVETFETFWIVTEGHSYQVSCVLDRFIPRLGPRPARRRSFFPRSLFAIGTRHVCVLCLNSYMLWFHNYPPVRSNGDPGFLLSFPTVILTVKEPSPGRRIASERVDYGQKKSPKQLSNGLFLVSSALHGGDGAANGGDTPRCNPRLAQPN